MKNGIYKESGNIITWYHNDLIHREYHPAVIWPDGSKQWYKEGKLHRDNDLPAIEWFIGTKEWYQNGLKHRTNGPAVELWNGCNMWYQHGKQHREDGPAVILDTFEQWWLYGVQYTQEEFQHYLDKKALGLKLDQHLTSQIMQSFKTKI